MKLPDSIEINWRLVAFYFGMPLILGVYAGLHNWQIQEAAGYLGTITFYLAHSFIPWWAT